MSRPFSKLPKTLDEQLSLLKSRRMLIEDHEQAKFYLKHLNYYRLRAYWLFFETDSTSHQFREGTRFQDVLDLYIFDREFRLLILDAIERIEVSIRSQWAYHLAHLHGSHAHLDQNLFDRRFWQRNLNDLMREVNRSEEDFVQHFQQTYTEPLPPVWVVCEVMSFGLLSRWFKTIRFAGTRAAIATTYNLRANFLESWLHHLAMIRNTCAHHSRLWNREFTVVPILITSPRQSLSNDFVSNSRNIYNTLVILLYLMDQVAPSHKWGKELKGLIYTCPQSLSAMGFPNDWDSRQIWQR
ncbi:Abi family protein [Synechocystis salina LEGE 06155]|nr:Abi family protein [Synechocystis salina LEGE 06155]MBE9195489.1 Abi family protein [Synechocystis sp. LEGE 06083]